MNKGRTTGSGLGCARDRGGPGHRGRSGHASCSVDEDVLKTFAQSGDRQEVRSIFPAQRGFSAEPRVGDAVFPRNSIGCGSPGGMPHPLGIPFSERDWCRHLRTRRRVVRGLASQEVHDGRSVRQPGEGSFSPSGAVGRSKPLAQSGDPPSPCLRSRIPRPCAHRSRVAPPPRAFQSPSLPGGGEDFSRVAGSFLPTPSVTPKEPHPTLFKRRSLGVRPAFRM